MGSSTNEPPGSAPASGDDAADESAVRSRGPDGKWQSVPSRPISDDPEVAAIGKLPMGELKRILRDESDPRHDVAREYNRLMGERLADETKPLLAQVAAPLLDGAGKGLKGIFGDVQEAFRVRDESFKTLLESSRPTSRPIVGPDFKDFKIPRNPTFDLLDEQRTLNALMLKTNTQLAAMVETAEKSAVHEKKVSRLALWAAWTAVGLTSLIGIAQIWVMYHLER